MALADIMALQQKRASAKIGLSEERVTAIIPHVRQYIAYWREYPDMFVDFLQTAGKDDIKKGLELRFYQRIFIRVAMRYRYVYAVYPRGYSKSFLAVLVLILRAILYPGAKLFTAAGGKQQSAGILSEKMDELCRMVPAFEKELDLRPGKTRKSKDKVFYMFKNGSFIDNLAISEKTRGVRRTAGVLEECASMDGVLLQEVIIPQHWGPNNVNYFENHVNPRQRGVLFIKANGERKNPVPSSFIEKVQRLRVMSVALQDRFCHYSKCVATV